MITKLVLENFKCFRKIEVEPRLITVFIGPNGTGKSSVLQALALIRQSLGRMDLDFGGYLFNVPESRAISPNFESPGVGYNFTITGHSYVRETGRKLFPDMIQYTYNASFVSGVLESSKGSLNFKFEDKQINLRLSSLPLQQTRMRIGENEFDAKGDCPIARVGRIVNWHGASASEYQSAINDLFDTPTEDLTKLYMVPSARGFVRPSYNLLNNSGNASISQGLGRQEEQVATNLGYDRDIEDITSTWLEEIAGVGLRGKTVPPQSVSVESSTAGGRINIVSEGFGANALIMLLMILAKAEAGSSVMIEEPEIHLHPKAQAELASLMAREAKTEKKQLIITTHSEHFLGRLLTLVAEGSLSSDDLAVYAFEKDDQGVCSAQNLEVTDDGRIKGGVKGFFEADLDELERYIKALQNGE